jgi:hypothetical protein
MMRNRDEILELIKTLDNKGERIIDILLEIQRRYQLDVQELPKLLSNEQKAKMRQQEAKLKTIKEN